MARDLTQFRAKIVNPTGGSGSIEWQGKRQSPAEMLRVLEQEHGAWGHYGVCRNFRLVGHQQSLTDWANMLGKPTGQNAMKFLASQGKHQAGMDLEPVPDIFPHPPEECCPRVRSSIWNICRAFARLLVSPGLSRAVLGAIAALFAAIIAALGNKIGNWIIGKLGG